MIITIKSGNLFFPDDYIHYGQQIDKNINDKNDKNSDAKNGCDCCCGC